MLDEDEERQVPHIMFALDGGLLFELHTRMGAEDRGRADEHRTGLDHNVGLLFPTWLNSNGGMITSTNSASHTAVSSGGTTDRVSRSGVRNHALVHHGRNPTLDEIATTIGVATRTAQGYFTVASSKADSSTHVDSCCCSSRPPRPTGAAQRERSIRS